MITSNAFMKRTFGKKLIEEYLPNWDMTHVIDTSGVYLPGHGTPTTILLGRNRPRIASTLRVVRGIRGEVAAPADPANAPVWSEIRNNLDQPGFSGGYVSVADAERETFHRHPWSIGGGGAAELKERLDEAGDSSVSSIIVSAGFASFPGLDEAFTLDPATAARRVAGNLVRPLVVGDSVRDWDL